jgi:hypothetical protein
VTLQSWLAARYRRAAFPDEFERRLSDGGAKNRLAKILASSGAYIRALFFDVDAGEDIVRAGPEDAYALDVVILYAGEDADAFKAATKASEQIEALFKKSFFTPQNGWRDIELQGCIVISDGAMTVDQASQLRQWRLEYMSLREDPPEPTLED